jgi:predicted dehydrogenase
MSFARAVRSTRMAILGCGGFARLYHVPTLLTDPRVELTMIGDPFAGDATRVLARETRRSSGRGHGCPWAVDPAS